MFLLLIYRQRSVTLFNINFFRLKKEMATFEMFFYGWNLSFISLRTDTNASFDNQNNLTNLQYNLIINQHE